MVDLVWSSGDPVLLVKSDEGGTTPAHHEVANSTSLVQANRSRRVIHDVPAGRFNIGVYNRDTPWNQETAEGNVSVHIIHFSQSTACPEQCNFNGECILQSGSTWVCSCNQGYSGDTCADDEGGSVPMLSLFLTALLMMGGMGLMGALTYAVASYFIHVVVPQLYHAPEAIDGSKTRDLDVEMLARVTLHLKASEDICAACDRCSICLAGIELGDSLRQIRACEHVFHVECIDDWFSRKLTCPLCRVPLDNECFDDDVTEYNLTLSDAAV